MSGSVVHDVIVVGGGPAGATVANLLASAGRDVLLLDRAGFPRPKPCGESLNPGAVRQLEALGMLDSVRLADHQPVTGWRIKPLRGRAFEARYPREAAGIAIERRALDAALLATAGDAGATIHTGVRVVDLIFEADHVIGVRTAEGTEPRGRVVVGADGLRSVVLRRLGFSTGPGIRKVALTAHVRGARLAAGRGTLDLMSWGCVGAVRITGEITNVVVVLSGRAVREIRADPGEAFDRLSRQVPQLSSTDRTSAVLATGPFDWPIRAVAAPGALLIGDAAGYFDPFTGQGICHALRSARVAARIIHEGLAGDASLSSMAAAYERWHRKSTSAVRRLQKAIEYGASHPLLFASAAAILRNCPPCADRLLAVTGDLRPVSSLWHLPMPFLRMRETAARGRSLSARR